MAQTIKLQERSAVLTKGEFGRSLENHMLNRGWNQSDLARHASYYVEGEVSRDSISGYVRGRNFPGDKILHAIARALDMKKEDLLPNVKSAATAADAMPTFEAKAVPGAPDTVWLRVNQQVSFEKSIKIMEILQS